MNTRLCKCKSKLIEKMMEVCPVSLFSPAQFTKAACQFRYSTYTSTVCMRSYMEVDVDLDFLSMCESGTCTAFYNLHIFLSLSFTSVFQGHAHLHIHIFTRTLRTFTAISTSPNTQRKKKLWQMHCVSSLAFLCRKLRTLCSVCRPLMYSHS